MQRDGHGTREASASYNRWGPNYLSLAAVLVRVLVTIVGGDDLRIRGFLVIDGDGSTSVFLGTFLLPILISLIRKFIAEVVASVQRYCDMSQRGHIMARDFILGPPNSEVFVEVWSKFRSIDERARGRKKSMVVAAAGAITAVGLLVGLLVVSPILATRYPEALILASMIEVYLTFSTITLTSAILEYEAEGSRMRSRMRSILRVVVICLQVLLSSADLRTKYGMRNAFMYSQWSKSLRLSEEQIESLVVENNEPFRLGWSKDYYIIDRKVSAEQEAGRLFVIDEAIIDRLRDSVSKRWGVGVGIGNRETIDLGLGVGIWMALIWYVVNEDGGVTDVEVKSIESAVALTLVLTAVAGALNHALPIAGLSIPRGFALGGPGDVKYWSVTRVLQAESNTPAGGISSGAHELQDGGRGDCYGPGESDNGVTLRAGNADVMTAPAVRTQLDSGISAVRARNAEIDDELDSMNQGVRRRGRLLENGAQKMCTSPIR